jgi:hypothetical protein
MIFNVVALGPHRPVDLLICVVEKPLQFLACEP